MTSNLLIGGTGFVGTALARALRQNGESVTSLAKSGSGDVVGVTYVNADLDQDPCPSDLLATDNVFILIGQTGPGFDANRELATLKGLAQQLKPGQQRVFYFSSALVYGNCQQPATEKTPLKPVGDYARFKRDSELIFTSIIPKERLTIFRPANIYGSPKNRGFISFLMNKLIDPTRELVINGDGHQERDYIFIDDLAAAVMAVKNSPDPAGIVTLGTGKSYSLIAVIAAAEKATGTTIDYTLSGQDIVEAETVRLDTNLLTKTYGFTTFVDLESGLRQTLERYQAHADH